MSILAIVNVPLMICTDRNTWAKCGKCWRTAHCLKHTAIQRNNI